MIEVFREAWGWLSGDGAQKQELVFEGWAGSVVLRGKQMP